MLSSDCYITTDRASRYLVQLCRHERFMSGMHHSPAGVGVHRPPRVHDVQYTDIEGVIRFSVGTCELTAHLDALRLQVTAADLPALERLQAGISARIETVARRDRLAPIWSRPSETAPEDRTVDGDDHQRSRLVRVPLLVALVGAVVAAHLAVAAATIPKVAALGWGAAAALLLIGIAVFTGHAVIGLAALHGAGRNVTAWRRRSGRSQRRDAAIRHLRRRPQNQ